MDPATVQARMRGDLPRAMKARDQVTVTALRTALAAIANAEALPGVSSAWTEPVVVHRHEAPRLELTAGEVETIIREQIASRRSTGAELAALGQAHEAAVLELEAAVLESYLP